MTGVHFSTLMPLTGMLKSVFAVRACSRKIGAYSYGTMTAFARGDVVVCISAKHVMPLVHSGGKLDVLTLEGWCPVDVIDVFESEDDEYDVVVVVVSPSGVLDGLPSTPSISDGFHGIALGSPAMYMGFPASWAEDEAAYLELYRVAVGFGASTGRFPMPMVKQTNVCFNHLRGVFGSLYFQGTANQGFSGSPLYTYVLNDGVLATSLFGVVVSHKRDRVVSVDARTRQTKTAEELMMYADASIAHPASVLIAEAEIWQKYPE